jgi:hypothetical protein
MKSLLIKVASLLLAGAHGRALNVLRKQAELSQPFHVEFRSNAGGWN